MMLETCRGMK